METANRRITAQDMSKLPRYAEGGLIGGIKDKLFGKPETVTEKFARQDAERAAKAAKAAPPLAPPLAPNTAIGQYAGATALENRMKAAGLKKGGEVQGPGTGTSDDVPIMGSNGEFMVKARAVKKLGLPFMHMINEIADGAKEQDGRAQAPKAPAHHMKKGGAVRCMAGGGLVDDDQRRAQVLANIPTGGYPKAPAAQPANWNTDTDLGRNVSNTIGALAPVAGAAPLAYGASRLGSMLGTTGNAAFVAPSAAKAYGTAAAGLGALVAAQSPAREQLAAVPAVASRPAVPQPNAPVLTGGPGQPVNVAQEQGPQPAQRPAASYYPAGSAAAREAGSRMDSGAAYIPTSGEGMIRNQGSGAVTQLRTAPQTMAVSQAMLQRIYAPAQNSGANKWIADQEQSMRDLRSSNSGASAGPGFIDELNAKRRANADQKLGAVRDANDLQAQTTRRGQDLQADSNTATHRLAQQKFGLDAQTQGFDNDAKAQVLSAQDRLASAATPEQRLAAEDQLRALQGKYGREAPPVRHLVVPGGQALDTNGQAYTMPSRVFNPDTQQFIEAPQNAQKPQVAEGSISTVNGKKAKYIGGKWVPQ